MTKSITFRFHKIPVPSKFAIFDKGNKTTIIAKEIPEGDFEIKLEVPSDWSHPTQNIRTQGYYIYDAMREIDSSKDTIEISGADYYIDVNRPTMVEERNKQSVETLIYTIHGDKNLSGRQRFYVSLVALQSYFENLVYGMLVLSGHKSSSEFRRLRDHATRTPIAFSKSNSDFFSDKISICPGKDNLGTIMDEATRIKLENIFNEVRTLRNKVVHRWGYSDVGITEIARIFEALGEWINTRQSEEQFYIDASFVCVRLYARASPLNNQLALFNEKDIVRREREERGFN